MFHPIWIKMEIFELNERLVWYSGPTCNWYRLFKLLIFRTISSNLDSFFLILRYLIHPNLFFSINNHKIINLLFCRKPFYGMNKLLIGHQFFSLRGMKKGLQIDFVTWYHVEVWSHFKPKTFDTLHVLSILTLLFALWIERKICVEKHCNFLCSCPGTAFYCMFTHSPTNK